MKFISLEEENAFQNIKPLLLFTRKMGLKKTEHQLIDYVKRRETLIKWNPYDINKIVEYYFCEILEKYPHQKRSLVMLENMIFERTNQCVLDNTQWDVLNGDWTSSTEYNEKLNVAELLSEKIRNTDDHQTKFLLMGLSINIQYEYFTNLPNGLVESLKQPTKKDKGEVDKIKEELLYVNEITFGRSDVCHIRNAFSHAHFIFIEGEKILLWDVWKGKINYVATFSVDDLRHIINSFNEKLSFIQGYAYLLNLTGLMLYSYSFLHERKRIKRIWNGHNYSYRAFYSAESDLNSTFHKRVDRRQLSEVDSHYRMEK